ncbi:hypothetical protein MFIFM68171_09603 [Madurella fahalii]|uniref:Uncharacterized protein n=1 Tax=Madurella fahalii TaxID=1157608 RepID=A0ABQ0GNS8_9PEZI
MARGLAFSILPGIFNGITFVLMLLVIFAGFDGRLTWLYWLRIDTAGLSSSARLAGSDFLDALSRISGADFVGSNVTAASLGLPDWSGVHLLTQCSHFPDGRVECSKPRYGFEFLPDRDLNIGISPLGGIRSEELRDALEAYQKASRFLAGAHVFSALTSFFAPIEAWFAPILAAVTCGIATIVLFASSVASTVILRRFVDAWNGEFERDGLSSSLGNNPIIIGFVACGLTLLATVLHILNHRWLSRGHHKRSFMARKVGGEGGLVGGGDSAYHGAGVGSGAWGRNKHKYVQIEEQQALNAHRDGEGMPDPEPRVPGSPDSVGKLRRLDEDWAAPDEYHTDGVAKPKTTSDPSIPLIALGGNKPTKDLNTAYEPFSDPK